VFNQKKKKEEYMKEEVEELSHLKMKKEKK
jgi:hypothetical protein